MWQRNKSNVIVMKIYIKTFRRVFLSFIQRHSIVLGLFFIIISPCMGLSQENKNILSLELLIKTTLEKNPQLLSLKNATLSDSAKIPQSGTLPDPILSFNILNLPTNSFAFDQEPMTGKQFALRQQFPFPGKLSLKEEISAENTAVSRATYDEYKNQLIMEIKQAYYDLFFIDKSIEITHKNQRLLEDFAKITETKYIVGKGIQQDVLKAQVEFSKLSDKMIQLEQKRTVKQAQINTLIDAPVNSKLGQTVTPEFRLMNEKLDWLQNMTINNRPLLKEWESMKKQSKLNVDLAKKDYWPDIGLYIAYTWRDELQNGNPGYDFLSAGISLKIPLYSGSKQSQKVEETQYSRNMVDEKYAQILNQVYYELEYTRSSAEKNARLVELFKTNIIPQASQSVESALKGYQTDKVDFLTLLSNQITLFNYDLDYYRVLSDYNKDIASLEFLTGVPLENEK